MLKIYDKLDEVPEALREHYELTAGKYIPKVADDHPLIVNNRKLLGEKDAAETKAADLQKQLDSAGANSLPRGHVAVPKSDAELLDKVKAHGTADEITAKLNGHKTLSARVSAQERREKLDKLRKSLGWNENAATVLELVPDLPEFEDREVTVNGEKKQVPHAKIKNGEEVTYEPFADYFAKNHAPLLPAVKADSSGGGDFITQADGATSTKDVFTRTREEVKANDGKRADDVNPIFKPRQAA